MPVPGEPAYDPTSVVPFIYRWRPGYDIAVYVDRTAEPEDVNLETAVRAAFAAWEPVTRLGDIRFHLVSDFRKADVIVHHFGAPRLVGSDVCEPLGVGFGGNSTFFCVTEDLRIHVLRPLDGGGGGARMDVSVNRNAVDDASIFPDLVAHEFGHVLGIGAHSPVAADLMNSRPRRPDPSENDIRTLRFVLSQRPDVVF
jgi:predicted Zn-dependent protease